MASVRTEIEGSTTVHVLEDDTGQTTARIATGYGFNCYSFRCRVAEETLELIVAADGFVAERLRPSANGIPVLFPFPNRIRGGRFQFNGQLYQLPTNERGGAGAIHGLVIDRAWRFDPAGDTQEAAITGRFQLSSDAPELAKLWPADFLIELTYRVATNRLSTQLRVTNPDSRPLPWGFGTHPYFRLPLGPDGSLARSSVQVPAEEIWELEQCLPTGRRTAVTDKLDLRQPRTLDELALDHVYTSLGQEDGWCHCSLKDHDAGVEVKFSFDGLFREVVVYNPPCRGSICIEPYTCATDAVNLAERGIDAGWQILPPGESAVANMVLEARSIEV